MLYYVIFIYSYIYVIFRVNRWGVAADCAMTYFLPNSGNLNSKNVNLTTYPFLTKSMIFCPSLSLWTNHSILAPCYWLTKLKRPCLVRGKRVLWGFLSNSSEDKEKHTAPSDEWGLEVFGRLGSPHWSNGSALGEEVFIISAHSALQQRWHHRGFSHLPIQAGDT